MTIKWTTKTKHVAFGNIGPLFVNVVGGDFISFRWFASMYAEGIDIDGYATVITALSEENDTCLYTTMEEAMEDAERRLSTILFHLAAAKEVA